MRKLFKMLLIMALGVFFVACGPKESIQIGFIGTLSGSNSEIGIAMRDGLLLKVDEVNQSGGINGRLIELIVRDDRNDPEQIKRINNEFLDMSVPVIFGHELSSKAAPMLEAVKDKEVIMMSPTLSTYELSGIDDNFFRSITSNYVQGTTLGTDANKRSKRTLIIYDERNAKFAEGVFKGYQDVFVGTTSLRSVQKPLTDVAEEIALEYVNGGYDSVLYIMNPNDVSYMSQVLFKNQLEVQIYSSNWGMATNALAEGGKAVEGAVFVSLLGNLDSPFYETYKENYIAKYNKDPEFASIYAYEAAVLLFEAMEKSDDMGYDSIKASLLNLEPQQGVLSELNFDAFGDVDRKSFIAVVIDGALVIQEE